MFSTSDKNIIIIIVISFDVANFVAKGGDIGYWVRCYKEFSFQEIYAPS